MPAPASEHDLCDVIATASAPFAIEGGGTRGFKGAGAPLSVAGLRGIELYEPGALTLVAAAGTPLSDIVEVLAAENQQLAFEPMDHRLLLGTTGHPTIGGVVAANVSGPRRVQVGACRDHLLGVRFVDGRGVALSNGGRVMKNVTGYDLVKLMAGSFGTLGVLTQVSLKVLPRPETEATLHVGVADMSAAVAAMSAALGSPWEVSGAAYLPDAEEAGVFLRIEGFEQSVTYRASQLEQALARFGPVSALADASESVALWRGVRDVAPFQSRPGDVWRFSVKPSDAPELAARLPLDGVMFDWGGGLIWGLSQPGVDLRPAMNGIGGHATLVRATSDTILTLGRFHPEPAPLAAITAGLRRQFDPRGILNAGLMGA